MPPVPDAFLRLASVSYIEFGTRGAPDREILRDISLAVQQGETVALMGLEHVGRTAILRAVAGLLQPTSGFVSLRQKKVEKPGPQRMFVFQDTELFPWLTLQQNLEEVLQAAGLGHFRGELRAQAAELLEQSGLGHLAGAYPQALSSADACWGRILRALAAKPDVLLLDDPFARMTVRERTELRERLRKTLHGRDVTVLLVTDDRAEAMLLADRIALVSPAPAARIREIVPVTRELDSNLEHVLKEALEGASKPSISVRTSVLHDA